MPDTTNQDPASLQAALNRMVQDGMALHMQRWLNALAESAGIEIEWVTPKDYENMPAARTSRGKIILNRRRFNPEDPRSVEDMYTAVLHELGHLLYSPRRGSQLLSDVRNKCNGNYQQEARAKKAMNLLEDFRNETVISAHWPTTRVWFTNLTIRVVLGGDITPDSWLYIAGREYLPAEIMQASRNAWEGDPAVLSEAQTIAAKYTRLRNPSLRNRKEAARLIMQFAELLPLEPTQEQQDKGSCQNEDFEPDGGAEDSGTSKLPPPPQPQQNPEPQEQKSDEQQQQQQQQEQEQEQQEQEQQPADQKPQEQEQEQDNTSQGGDESNEEQSKSNETEDDSKSEDGSGAKSNEGDSGEDTESGESSEGSGKEDGSEGSEGDSQNESDESSDGSAGEDGKSESDTKDGDSSNDSESGEDSGDGDSNDSGDEGSEESNSDSGDSGDTSQGGDNTSEATSDDKNESASDNGDGSGSGENKSNAQMLKDLLEQTRESKEFTEAREAYKGALDQGMNNKKGLLAEAVTDEQTRVYGRPPSEAHRNASRRIATLMREITSRVRPGWDKNRRVGTFDVPSYISQIQRPRRVFKKYDPGQLRAVDIHVEILVDQSGSMGDRARQAIEMAHTIKVACDDIKATCAVHVYGSTCKTMWNAEERAVPNRVPAYYDGGGTNIEDALIEAYRNCSRRKASVKMVLILTDGKYTDVRPDSPELQGLMRAISRTGARSHLFFLVDPHRPRRSSQAAEMLRTSCFTDTARTIISVDEVIEYFRETLIKDMRKVLTARSNTA